MNTIETKGTYKSITKFLNEGGEFLSWNKSFKQCFINYYKYIVSKGNSIGTIYRKLGTITRFFNYLNKSNIKLVSKIDIYDYLYEINNLDWGYSEKDRERYNLKTFLNWAYENGYITFNGHSVISKILWHRNSNIRTYYSKSEIEKLLNVINIKSKQGKEHYLIISLICYLGLRISDVVYLKLENIDFNTNEINIIQFKTKESLTLPLIDKVKYPLLDYLRNVRPSNCELDYIFVTYEEPYIHKENLRTHNHIIKNYFNKARIDTNGRKAGFHALRHSLATILLSQNVPLYSVSTILGHTDLPTTTAYLDIDISKLRELALEVKVW